MSNIRYLTFVLLYVASIFLTNWAINYLVCCPVDIITTMNHTVLFPELFSTVKLLYSRRLNPVLLKASNLYQPSTKHNIIPSKPISVFFTFVLANLLFCGNHTVAKHIVLFLEELYSTVKLCYSQRLNLVLPNASNVYQPAQSTSWSLILLSCMGLLTEKKYRCKWEEIQALHGQNCRSYWSWGSTWFMYKGKKERKKARLVLC